MDRLRRTQLYSVHERTAKLTPFAGFEMPLWYRGIIPEHMAVRQSVGIFDISHMGRVIITGSDSESYLNYVITNDVSKLSPNAALYSVMCNERGGIIDDFVVYRLELNKFLVVFNAGNREKDYDWMIRNSKDYDVKIENVSDAVAMIAVQGPNAEETLQKLSSADINKIERFKCGSLDLAHEDVFISRTGYTGEDGFEVFVWNASLSNPDRAVKLWEALMKAGNPFVVEPCGLGARDTLRLEAGLCLYGNDIDEKTTPFEAGLGFVVKLQKDKFIGRESLQRQKSEGTKIKRVGIQMVSEGIPRAGFEIFSVAGEKIGQLTSGTFSPLLKYGIGMGYVPTIWAQEEDIVEVRIRNKLSKAKMVSFPFYDTEKYGFKRKKV